MRYFYELPESFTSVFNKHYICNHPAYNECTLYEIRSKGLAVIQQRIDESKKTYWGPLPNALAHDIYMHPKFYDFFLKYSGEAIDGLYPTVTARQIMWALRMKPLKKMEWETTFDHKPF